MVLGSVCTVKSNCNNHCIADLQNCINNCSNTNSTDYCGISIESGSYDWYVNGEHEGGYITINQKSNIEIYGASNQSTNIMIHGLHGIFNVYQCINITIRDITFDFYRYPYTFGRVININKSSNRFTVKIDNKLYPFPPNPYLNDGQNYSFVSKLSSLLGYDNINKHPIFPDIYTNSTNTIITIKNNTNNEEIVVYLGQNQGGLQQILINSFIILRHNGPYTAFVAVECVDFKMKNIILFTQPGMAFFAAKTHNIHLFGVQFKKNINRPLSTLADSAHLVSNTGDIIIENSTFEGQGDDGLNILNEFFEIDKVLSSNSLQIERNGINNNIVGSIIIGNIYEFRNRRTLQPYFHSNVTNISYINNINIITFLDKIPIDLLNISDIITDVTSLPTNVLLINNIYSSSRARGTLLKVSNVSFINNKYINITGPAILIRPESAYWLESTVSNNMYIYNNYIFNCNYGPAQQNGTIMITATICGWTNNSIPNKNEYPLQIGQVHKNFTIINNIFNQIMDNNTKYIDHSAISIRAVDTFLINNNTFNIPSNNYTVLQKFNNAGLQQFNNDKCLINLKETSCVVD